MSPRSITVSALNAYVKALLDADDVIHGLWVEGELSNFTVGRTGGHLYFSLKDASASVRAVMFKSAASALRFLPKDGMKVLVRCSASLYERDGAFQIIVSEMTPRGAGEQNELLEKLRQKLASEGVFDEKRKRPLPAFPNRIAVVTSAAGAAVRDIINVIGRRYPAVTLVICHASVQGFEAEGELVSALSALSKRQDVDLAIIARGGGSKEDLFVFNSELVIRAAISLPFPFISAVGHETDFTLLDYASDLRAPTPSAAAELAVPDKSILMADIISSYYFCAGEVINKRQALMNEAKRLAGQASESARKKVRTLSERASALAKSINDVSPLGTLARGYAIAVKDGEKVSTVTRLSAGDSVRLLLKDGSAACTVDETSEVSEFGRL